MGMVLLRLFHTLASGALAAAMLLACSDGQSPKPPPRVPKPKVEREAIDPLRTTPAEDKRVKQV